MFLLQHWQGCRTRTRFTCSVLSRIRSSCCKNWYECPVRKPVPISYKYIRLYLQNTKTRDLFHRLYSVIVYRGLGVPVVKLAWGSSEDSVLLVVQLVHVLMSIGESVFLLRDLVWMLSERWFTCRVADTYVHRGFHCSWCKLSTAFKTMFNSIKIKRNDWLLADTCPKAANHCALFLRRITTIITGRNA